VLDLPPAGPSPAISVVIVLFNQAAMTLRCIRALRAMKKCDFETIIVDNASTDETTSLLVRVRGARIVANAENIHFLRAANQGAAAATGTALLFLNNDAFPRPGSLDFARETLSSTGDVGVVAAKLIRPGDILQEAGSIVWNDGACLGYGRGSDPDAGEFNFRRDVDYGSGAFLLVRRALFEAFGGFDAAYAPAYYEETDFCLRLAATGYRCVYDPRVVVDHVEFGSASASDKAIALQRAHQAVFVARHRAELERNHLPPGTSVVRARHAYRDRERARILVIDDQVPFAREGGGLPRAGDVLRTLADAGWGVTFYPLLYPGGAWDDIWRDFPLEIEFVIGRGAGGLSAFLAERAGYYARIWVSRPHNMRRFLSAARALPAQAPAGALIYDAEALFAERELGRRALAGRPANEIERRTLLAAETALAAKAGLAVAVSERDAAELRAGGLRRVAVLGHALSPQPTAPPFGERRDLLFVGALLRDGTPNADSLQWFVAEVMPRLDALIGTGWRLIVVGKCEARGVMALAGTRVALVGPARDLGAWFSGARIFVAPTRFAAGIPHKVHEAAARGLPMVVTGLLAQQLGWRNDVELLAAETAEAFAGCCAALYTDAGLWARLRAAALARVEIDCDPARFRRSLLDIVSGLTGSDAPAPVAATA
jgi:GT2 family glycosyltransferase